MSKNTLFLCLFAGSVILNAFFAGIFCSRMMVMPKHFPPPPFAGGMMVGPIPNILKDKENPEIMKKVAEIRTKYRDSAHDDMRVMHDLFTQMKDALTAEKFDPAAITALQDKIDTKDRSIKSNIAQMMTDIATTLPDKERILFFENMMHFPPPMPMRPPMGHRNHSAPHEMPPSMQP